MQRTLRSRTSSQALAVLVAACLLAGLWLLVGPDGRIQGTTRTNLLTVEQQSFEGGSTTGWSAESPAGIGNARSGYVGRRSMAVANGRWRDGAKPTVAAVTTRTGTSGVKATAGTSYTGSAYVRAVTGPRGARCELRWFSADGKVLATSQGPDRPSSTTGWSPIDCAGVAPDRTATVALRVVFSGLGSRDVHYVDEASLVVTPATSAPPFALRINAASGSSLVTPSGAEFVADQDFLGGAASGTISNDISGTDVDALYGKHRWGMQGYAIAVPTNATYTVRMHFAETVFSNAGQRVFDVTAEGATRVDDLDVAAVAGQDQALVRQFEVPVSDGTLDLGFAAVVEDPMVSAIEVLSTAVSAVPGGGTASTTTAAAPATTTTAPQATTTTTAPQATTTTTAPKATTTTTAPTSPPPSSTGFPNASNTGPSGTLSPSGSITTSNDGQVIQNLDIAGEIRVQHNNVVIRNVRIRSEGGHAIYVLNNTGLLVEDCELDGQGRNATAAIAEHNYTMRRCEIRGYGEGPRINGNVLLEDNYIHGFANFVAQGAHQDCIQATSGTNITIRHNTCLIEPDGANGSVFFSTSEGSNILIENNLLGGGNWAIQVDPDRYTNVRVLNNRFTTTIPYHEKGGYFGAMSLGPNVVKSGNVWHDGPNAGQPAT